MLHQFDHEKLDVYRLSIEFVGWVARLVPGLKGDARFPRIQLVRSAQSIPQNIAEGNGKRAGDDRKRFFEIARGSAMESAATLDILVSIGAKSREEIDYGKELLIRIVQMLTNLAHPQRGREASMGKTKTDYEYDYDYENEKTKL